MASVLPSVFAVYSSDGSTWPSQGRPLDPYLLGFLKRYLLERLAPRDPKLPRIIRVCLNKDFLEYSLLRSWVESYLVYCQLSFHPLAPGVLLWSCC